MGQRSAPSNPICLFFQREGETRELVRTLSELGIQGEGFDDPKEYLHRVNQAHPSLCIIDLTLPSGAEPKQALVMIAIVKSIRKVLGPTPPIVGLTRKGDPLTREAARLAGVDDFVDKPFSYPRLLKALAPYVSTPKLLQSLSVTDVQKIGAVAVPELVTWFFDKISPAMSGLSGSLENYDQIEEQWKFYAERMLPYRELFINMVSSLRKTEVKPDLIQSLRLYGVRNVRNLVVATKISEVTGANVMQWSAKTGLPTSDAQKIIPYAVKAVDHFGEDSRYREVAFNSGLILDLLNLLAESVGGRKSVVRKSLDQSFGEALKRADAAIAAGKKSKNLVLELHIVTAFLMRVAGRIAMAIFFPDYLDLDGALDKKSVPPVLRHIIEEEKFKVSHNLVGALICQGAPELGAAYQAVLFFDHPELLEGDPDNKDALDLVKACNR